MASQRVNRVLKGYMQLDPSEQREFQKEFKDMLDRIAKGGIIKEGNRLDGEISLGPLQRSCPCCGR